MTDFAALLAGLAQHEVAFILVGGAAAIAPHKPYLRGAPPGLPFLWDRNTLTRGLNFTLTTSLGDLDLLGEIPGGGSYEDLLPGAIDLDVFQTHCRCLSLPQLIRAKRAAGRPRDLEALAELEAIEDEST